MLSGFLAPAKPGEKSFDQIVETFTAHFDPAPLEIIEHFTFNTRVWKTSKSIAIYVSELRTIAKNCNFGETLETMLRDRLVCGVNNPIIQCRLLSEKALTLKTAMELSQGMESTAKYVKELTSQPADSSNGSESSIHKVTASLPQGRCCYRCGKPGHYATICKFKDAKCHKCGKVGHLQKVCQSKVKK